MWQTQTAEASARKLVNSLAPLAVKQRAYAVEASRPVLQPDDSILPLDRLKRKFDGPSGQEEPPTWA
jgi:hypothetical protein